MSKKFSGSTVLVIILAVCGFLFLYLPVVVVVMYSFNTDAISSFPMSGLTLKWYKAMFANTDLIKSLRNSLIVAFRALTECISLSSPVKKHLRKW